MRVPFRKMSGAGNDFVVLDWRSGIGPDALRALASMLCDRRRGIGADGCMLLEPGTRADVRVHYVNADGSDAGMCGNGARCAALDAARVGLGPATGRVTLDFGDLVVRAERDAGDAAVRVSLGAPRRPVRAVKIEAGGRALTAYHVDTGVPHAVVTVPAIGDLDVIGLGGEIRRHLAFAPEGVNVDFVEERAHGPVPMRTYERGVEGETLACGTGAAAVALVAMNSWGRPSPVAVATRGGETLVVHVAGAAAHPDDVVLEGSARLVFEGEIDVDRPGMEAGSQASGPRPAAMKDGG